MKIWEDASGALAVTDAWAEGIDVLFIGQPGDRILHGVAVDRDEVADLVNVLSRWLGENAEALAPSNRR